MALRRVVSSTNRFGFTDPQIAAGFQSANIAGSQYSFAEAPRSYVAEHPVFGSDSGSSYRYDESFGILGSLIGPHSRQALNTPITGRAPSLTVNNYYNAATGQSLDSNADSLRSYSVNTSIDWALGEKQATFGTPEYFRKAYRDSIDADPAIMDYGARLVLSTAGGPNDRQAYWDSQRTYEDSSGTRVSLKSPTLSASKAINGGYQNDRVRISSGVEQVASGMWDMVPYMSSSAASAHTAVYRQNEQYLGTGTGDFRGPTYSISARPTTNTVRGAFEPDQSYSQFGRPSLSYPTTSGGYRLRF